MTTTVAPSPSSSRNGHAGRTGWAAVHDSEQAIAEARAAVTAGDRWARADLRRGLLEMAAACAELAERMDPPTIAFAETAGRAESSAEAA